MRADALMKRNKVQNSETERIDNAAKLILDVYRDAFTELAKGTDI